MRIRYLPTDILDSLSGERDELIPPKGMWFVGSGNFTEVGETFFQYFVDLGDLKPNERVLEVGCGIGRMAIPLTKYLTNGGSYEGFDIVPEAIKWCNQNIAQAYPNFNFKLADLYNKEYNLKGKHKASEYKFPYPSNSFDFVFLSSVFTHMLPPDMENYCSEIARILKKGGRCLITFFLVNSESSELINKDLSKLNFEHDFGVYRSTNKSIPEEAIGYDEKFVCKLFEEHGLRIKQPIYYGSWCGRKNFLSFQDIVLATKE
jgi:SAM-dependent methyltransferase